MLHSAVFVYWMFCVLLLVCICISVCLLCRINNSNSVDCQFSRDRFIKEHATSQCVVSMTTRLATPSHRRKVVLLQERRHRPYGTLSVVILLWRPFCAFHLSVAALFTFALCARAVLLNNQACAFHSLPSDDTHDTILLKDWQNNDPVNKQIDS